MDHYLEKVDMELLAKYGSQTLKKETLLYNRAKLDEEIKEVEEAASALRKQIADQMNG